jgi:hypothetical protein
MAIWHLEELENRIQQLGWRIVSRIDGDGYRISGSWMIVRKTERQLDFQGMDDLIVKPMDQAYGCEIGGTKATLYFYKKGKQWDDALAKFMNELNHLD